MALLKAARVFAFATDVAPPDKVTVVARANKSFDTPESVRELTLSWIASIFILDNALVLLVRVFASE